MFLCEGQLVAGLLSNLGSPLGLDRLSATSHDPSMTLAQCPSSGPGDVWTSKGSPRRLQGPACGEAWPQPTFDA